MTAPAVRMRVEPAPVATAPDRGTARETLIAAAVYLLCILALAWPILAGKFLINPHSDEYIAGFAFRDYGARMLKETGQFPLWNPYLFGGVPFVAGMGGDMFYPPSMLMRALLPTDLAMSLAFAVHTFLCGLFTYLFLRASRVSFGGALVGGVVYMLSGAVAGLASPGHDGKVYVSALTPLALLLILRGVRDGKLWRGLLSLVVGFAVLSPHPQSLQYMLLLAGAWALFVAFSTWDGPALPRPLAIPRLGYALGAVLLGAAMGTVQYLPVHEYVPWSPRSGGMGWEHAISYAFPPVELFNAYLPEFTGILGAYSGRNYIHLHSDYVGVVALVLAVAGLAHARLGRFRWFWVGTAIVSFLWAVGGSTPFFYLVYYLVPGTKFFRAPSIIIYLFALSTSVLAALGTERVIAGQISRRTLYVWAGFGVAVLFFAVTGVLTTISVNTAHEALIDAALANKPAVMDGSVRSLFILLLTIGLIEACRRGRLAPRNAAYAFALAAAADLWWVERQYWQFSPPASVTYASNPAIEYMKAQPQPGRVIAIPLAEYDGRPGNDADLKGSSLMTHGVRQVRGYHGNEIRYYDDLIAENGQEQNQIFASERFQQIANVRYFLTNVPTPPLPNLTKVVGPVKDAVGNTVYLYQTAAANPYAWVTPARLKASDERVFSTLYEQRLPQVVRQVAMFDTSAAVDAPTDMKTLPDTIAVPTTVTTYAPGRVSIALGAPAPAGSALVASENYYPGWVATVDGKPNPIGRADYSLIGVPLPAGARRVDLTFTSPTYETGKTVTLAAAALALLLIGVGAVAGKRSTRA
jgi:Bacterial membrane protein YfhO